MRYTLPLLMLLASLVAKADYISLTVKENSGTWTSYGLAGLKVVFNADNITVSDNTMTHTYPLSDVYSLSLTDLPTGIKNTAQHKTTAVSLQSGRIYLDVEPGTIAYIYDTTGRLYSTTRIGQQGTPVSIGNLLPGIYIIKAGKEQCKILVK